MNIAALVSGGVDSSVVVHLLKEQGYTPDIFYIRIGMEDEEGYIDCPAEEDIEITQWIAKKYGCRFEEVNLHKEYWDNVVSYTIESVRKGLTPNPDVMCNKLIKFGAFDDKRGHDYDRIATGHYARTEQVDSGRWTVDSGATQDGGVQQGTDYSSPITFLATAKDTVKDQTDFLSQLSYKQIQKLMFPIGHLMKSEVRAIAHEAHLPSADRKDSQGICFLGKINYNDFIRRYLGEREGKIVELETGKVLGTHKGYCMCSRGSVIPLFIDQIRAGDPITVTNPEGSHMLRISVTNKDPVAATWVSNTLAEVMCDQIAEIMKSERPQFVEEASLGVKTSPYVRRDALIGGVVFGLIAAIFVLVRYFVNDTITTEEDVNRYLGLTILSSVPLERNMTKQ